MTWKFLRGEQNSETGLENKGRSVAGLMTKAAAENAHALLEIIQGSRCGSEDDTEEEFVGIFIEFVYLYLHIGDRLAFELLGAEKRNVFVDALREKTLDILSEGYDSKAARDEFCAGFGEALDARESIYSTYRWGPGEDGGLEGELLWEFAKYMGKSMGANMDPAIILGIQKLVAQSLVSFELPRLLKG